ncbi:MAG: toll/interleukin-1 receptor domain-containing protein [Planctomyces sp.]|nr:toll/interleukin-1 receptor domain-containing protein [Planctomyces sp.]
MTTGISTAATNIPEEIRRQLRRSREIVVLLTPESVNRPWVLLEVGAAWGLSRRMRITPVLCHTPFDMIPDMIRNKKAIRLNEMNAYLAELSRRVESGT